MKRALGIALVIFLVAASGWAQQVPADSSATKEDIEKLFDTLHLREMMKNMMATSMQQSKQMANDTLRKKKPGISEQELQRMDSFMAEFTKTLDVSGMLDDFIPIYQRHLTRQDVQAMLAFYDSPTGQKILREQPAMMAEGMQAMQPRMRKMMEDIMDKAEKMAREDQEKSIKPAAQ